MKKMKYIALLGFFTFLGMESIHAGELCADLGNDALPIPIGIPNFISKLILLAQIAVPIMIIIGAMIRYFKVVGSNDEKAAKEANSSFVRSLITGAAIFLIVVIVKFVFNLVGDNGTSSLRYVSCFLNGQKSCDTITCPKRGELQTDSSQKMDYACYKCNSEISSGNNTDRYIWHQGNPGTSYNNGACPANWSIEKSVTSKDECKSLNVQHFACYQCLSNPSVYKWSTEMGADSSCPAGYHSTTLGQNECHS